MGSAEVDEALREINQWVVDLDSININELHPKVQCELLMIAEDSPSYTKMVKKIEFYSKVTTDGKVRTISTKDIYDLVNNYHDRLRHWDDRFYYICSSACSEAYVYVLSQKPIPVDLLVKLIKLKIISIINEIIYVQKMVGTLRQQRNFFRAPPRENGETTKKGKKKDKTDKGAKAKEKKGKKGKETVTVVVNPCLEYKYEPAQNVVPDQNTVIPGDFVYIALIYFYLPNLIPFCYWNGMPVQCVIKYGESRIKYSKFTSETTLNSIHYDEDYPVLKPDIKYAPKPILHKKKEQTLLLFWRRVNMMYNVQKPECIKHSFIMNYSPLFFSVESRNRKMYLHLCERLYYDFLEFVEKLADYKRQYITYLNSMNVYHLDLQPKKLELSDMQVYNNAMDALPIDVVTISLILDSLICEVSNQEAKSGISITTDESTQKDDTGQSHYFELDDKMCHRTLRDHLKNIFLHFKTAHCRYIPPPGAHVGNFGLSVNDKPYISHESNLIEMTLNYYKFLPESILDTLVTYLKKNPCISSITDIPLLSDDAISRNRKELREWCSLMKVDEGDLFLVLSVILTSLFVHSEVVLTSNESLNIEKFPVQKAVHEIQANIWNKGSRKAMGCMEHTNPYEKISPLELKWVERLPPTVALQELTRATEQFECVDQRYVELLDTMLYRFHHNADEFGITTKFWKEYIRSPVTLNDFMTYAIHTDIRTVIDQEKRHIDEVHLCHYIKDTIDNMSDFSRRSDDFLLPDCIKTSYDNEVQVAPETKNKKGNKDKPKKGVTEPKDKKTKKNGIFDAQTIIEDEPFKSELSRYECNYAILQEIDPAPCIPAVNFDGLLLTSSGITTSFYSLDDLKVTVDQVQICDDETKLSAKVGLNGHDLIVHRENKSCPFSFLVNFKSGVTLACGTPTTYSTTKENDFYLMTEESDQVVNCMRSLFQSKKCFAVSDKVFRELISAYNTTKETNDTPEIYRTTTNNTMPKSSIKEVVITPSGAGADKKRKSTTAGGSKIQDQGISLQSLGRKPVEISTASVIDEKLTFTRHGFYSEIKILKKQINAVPPKFKVLSSRLHKYKFLKRITTPLEMDLNEIIRFVARTKKQNQCHLSVKRRYNIRRESAGEHKTTYDYDFRVTLPSGLHLRNVVGEKGTSICQYYFQKGATCSPIFDEDCRLFLGNGTVTVKKDNGQFIIYCANAEIIKYQTAYVESTHESKLFRKNIDSRKQVPKFLKRVRRNLYNLTKNGRQSNYMSSRRMSKKQVKKNFCHQQTSIPFSAIKFTFTTSEGRVLYYDNGTITDSSGYYVEKEDLMKMGQVVFRREDGTTSILTDEGHMQTTFSDGTKITVWCEIDSEPIVIDLRDKFGSECEDMGPFVKIVTCYQYEHPHYITVLSNGSDEKLMMRLASGEIFDITNRHFLIGIDEWTTLLANKEVIRFVGTPCDECGKFCECDFDISQLYNPSLDVDNDKIFLRVNDTYNKSFIVHYDGSSERNEEYDSDKNRCIHYSHKTQPCQAFFTLNRDFSGCALWTSDDYNKRLSEAKNYDTNYIVFYVDKSRDKILSTEWKTFERQHYNFRFIWPQFNAYKDEAEEFDTSTAAFVKQRILKRIPRNTVRNFIKYIFNQNVELFASSRAEMKMMLSSTKTSLLPSLCDFTTFISRSREKAMFEKKIKNKNKECNDIVDKIIEYFVKKTGRYYRSKVYEDFCGVKLMLDDEEEIFFLANFDTSSTSTTTNDTTSFDNLRNDDNPKKNLSVSMELMLSRMCKSTSAVQTAVEVIKQLEMEIQREKPKPSYLTSKQSIDKLKRLLNTSSHSFLDSGKQFSKLIPVVGPLSSKKSLDVLDNKTSISKHDHLPSILKTSNLPPASEHANEMLVVELKSHSSSSSPFASQCDINLQPLAVAKAANEKDVSTAEIQLSQVVEGNIMTENQSKEKIEESKILQDIVSESSSIDAVEYTAGHDIDAVCSVIAQTLRRIKQEKFGDFKASDYEIHRDLSLQPERKEESSSLIMSINSESETAAPKPTILRNLFNVSREKVTVDIEKKDSDEACYVNQNRSAIEKCYSDFSLKDTGLAECEQFLRDPQEPKESMLSLTKAPKHISSSEAQHVFTKRSVAYLPDDQIQKEHPSTQDHWFSMPSMTSVDEDFNQSEIKDTPSMIPLLNIQSLTLNHSVPNVARMSVISFMSNQGKTPSMKVLRSMSEIEKDYQFVLVENTGIVTDKHPCEEVQTDIVYEDFKDDELE